jgi:amino acid transporter
MTEPTSSGTHELKRVLRLGDLVLFNVVAVLGLRWVATSAKAGPSSIVLWLLAAALFFVPQGIAVITLSSRFPDEGGVYAWTRRTYGEWNGFLCGWCYWINNVLYYPNLLISTAVIATYAIGKGGTTLGASWGYVLSVALVALWTATLLNIVGLGTGKWLHNIGGVATYLPGIILIALGLTAVVMRPSANAFTSSNIIPDVTDLSTLNLWASIAFAFAGLELSSTMGEETANPRRDLPRAILIAAPLIAAAYVLGTLSVLWLVPNGDLNIVSGFLQGITAGAAAISPNLLWIAPFAAALYTISNVAGVGAWLSGPARVAFAIGLDRYFPPAFGKVHPKWRTPYVAILVQAALATVFLLISQLGKGSTVEHAYLILLDTQLLIYFIPYL